MVEGEPKARRSILATGMRSNGRGNPGNIHSRFRVTPIEIETRSRSAPVVKEYELPFALEEQ